jgi:cysteine desulfurase
MEARETLANVLGGPPEAWVFTSGGTEADNLAVLGVAMAQQQQDPMRKHIVVSAIEHSAVRNPARWLAQQGWQVTFLPVNGEGVVSVDDVAAALTPHTALVSVMHANNEVGSIQPIAEIAAMLRARGGEVPFHTDAVQTVGKLPVHVADLGVDYLSLSAHKFYGPKGVGALYVRPGALAPQPLFYGGGHEAGLRAGTENVAGIVGLAAALKLAIDGLPEESARLRQLQAQWLDQLPRRVPVAQCNGPSQPMQRVPGNLNFSFPPIEGESLVLSLDLKGIAVSSGSACHSGKIDPSHVLLAMGKSTQVARSTVRFSLGKHTRPADLDRVLDVLPGIVERLGGRQRMATSF